MTTTIKAAVTFKGQVEGKDFYKVILGGNMNFTLNEKDPVLTKFVKGYVLTVEVQQIVANVAAPKDEHKKSLKTMLDWAPTAKAFVNLKGVKIIGAEKPVAASSDLDSLPDVDDTITTTTMTDRHLKLVGRV